MSMVVHPRKWACWGKRWTNFHPLQCKRQPVKVHSRKQSLHPSISGDLESAHSSSIFCHFKDGTDPAMVVKSLPNFVNHGQRNKESLAELFVTLLIKLSCVKKLWAEGSCASACSAFWTSKIFN